MLRDETTSYFGSFHDQFRHSPERAESLGSVLLRRPCCPEPRGAASPHPRDQPRQAIALRVPSNLHRRRVRRAHLLQQLRQLLRLLRQGRERTRPNLLQQVRYLLLLLRRRRVGRECARPSRWRERRRRE